MSNHISNLGSFIFIVFTISHARTSWFNPPRIWLHEYVLEDSPEEIPAEDSFRMGDFQNDFISKNGSDFVPSEEVASVMFACEADYPVQWTFPSPEQFQDIGDSYLHAFGHRKSLFHEGLEEPENLLFREYLTVRIPSAGFVSANITCEAVPHPLISASVYLFMKAPYDDIQIEKQGQTINVPYPTQIDRDPNTQLIIPCRPARPDDEILLDIKIVYSDQNPNVSNWVSLYPPRSKYIWFDPKVGFISRHPKTVDRYGSYKTYRCTLNEDDLEDTEEKKSVIVTFTSQQNLNDTFEVISNLNGHARINITHSGTYIYASITCCTGRRKAAPLGFTSQCENPAICQLYKQLIKHRSNEKGNKTEEYRYDPDDLTNFDQPDCTSKYLVHRKGSSVVIFQGETVDFAQQYIKLFRTSINQSNTDESCYEVADALKAETANVEQKAQIRIGVPYVYDFSSVEQPENRPNHANYHSASKDFDSYTILDPSGTLTEEFMDIWNVRNVYDGEVVKFMCFYLRYFYSRGAYLRVNWENGTKSILELDDKSIYLYTYPHRLLEGDTFVFSTFSKSIPVSLEMTSVDCFVPTLGTTKWDKLTHTLNISSSILPKFKGDEEETIYISINESGLEIVCEIQEGLPKPSIRVLKDGKEWIDYPLFEEHVLANISDLVRHNSSVGKVIRFATTTFETHGVFQCTAENVKGKVVKTVYIMIGGQPSHWKGILLAIVAVGALILVGIALIYCLKQRGVIRSNILAFAK